NFCRASDGLSSCAISSPNSYSGKGAANRSWCVSVGLSPLAFLTTWSSNGCRLYTGFQRTWVSAVLDTVYHGYVLCVIRRNVTHQIVVARAFPQRIWSTDQLVNSGHHVIFLCLTQVSFTAAGFSCRLHRHIVRYRRDPASTQRHH